MSITSGTIAVQTQRTPAERAQDQVVQVHASLVAQGASVVLDREVLGGDRLPDLWMETLKVAELRLDRAVVGDLDSAGGFAVSGVLPLLGFGAIPVELGVFSSAAGPEVLVRVAAPVLSWTPSHDLPDLPPTADPATGAPVPSFLHGVTLPQAGLMHSSFDSGAFEGPPATVAGALTGAAGRPVQPGLNFRARFDPAGHDWLDPVRALTGLTAPLDLYGCVGTTDGSAERTGLLTLHLALGGLSVTLGSLTLRLDEIVVTSGLTVESALAPEISLLATLATTAGDFPLLVEFDVAGSTVQISGGDAGHLLPLDDVATALGLGAAQLAPGISTTSVLGNVGITRLELMAGLSPAGVQSAELVLTSRVPWTLLGGQITFQPQLELSLTDPHGPAAATTLVLRGHWVVDGNLIEVIWSPTAGTFSAALEAGRSGAGGGLDAGALLSPLLPGHPPLTLQLSAVRIWGDSTDDSFAAELVADDALRLPCGSSELRLADLRVLAEHDGTGGTGTGGTGTGTGTGNRWSLSANLSLGGVHLLVTARHSAGWLVDARGWADGAIDLGALVDHALSQFHGAAHPWPDLIPEGYARLTIRQVALTYDETSQAMTVFVDLATDLQILQGVQFTHLTTSLEFGPAGFVRGFVTAAVEVAGVEVDLAAAQDPDHGLVLTGKLAPGQSISAGAVLDDLTRLAGVPVTLPTAVAGLTLNQVDLSFAPSSGHLTAHLHGTLPGLNPGDLTVIIDVTRHQDIAGTTATQVEFTGTLAAGGLIFALELAHAGAGTELIASLIGDAVSALDLNQLAAAISPSLAAQVSAGIQLDLDEIVFVHDSTGQAGQAGQTVLAAALRTSLNLAALPLVGEVIHDPFEVSIQPLALAQAATADQLTQLNARLPAGPVKLPAADLAAGLHLESRLLAGSLDFRLGLPIAASASGAVVTPAGVTAPAGPVDQPAATTDDGTKWFKLDRSFGPVHIDRVGVSFAAGELGAHLDGSISLAGLTLELMDLGVATALHPIEPHFSLRGVSLDYHNGDLEIGGTFLRETITPTQGPAYDEYGGRVVLKTPALSLTALGLYGNFNGKPSLFLYAVLTEPIGGPAFFFVTGLAAGLAYNRELVVPAIDRVATFPLVREATGKLAPQDDLRDELHQLGQAIRPADGMMFLAAGVAFTSFKLIDSFVLVVVQFGTRLEIDVLGLSTAIVPTPELGAAVPPLAEIQLAVSARFVPAEGTLAIRAQLTSASYLISPNCRISGGFAFSAWFGATHNGEFVVTLGGYHPHYSKPAHYPDVPKLELNWPVDDYLTVKGGVYFALTGSAVMAGAHFDAQYVNGNLSVAFHAGIDMLLAWKPYYYEAELDVSLQASYTFHLFGTHHLELSINADLHFWGPEFAGRATLDLGVTSIDVRFGPRTAARPTPIDYDTFAASFLPPPATTCSITALSGLVATVTEGKTEYWVMHPKHLEIVVQSAFPPNDPASPQVAIGPVAVAGSDLSSVLSVTIDGDDASLLSVTPLRRGVPAAMWGSALLPSASDPAMVENTQVGYTIAPRTAPEATASAPLDLADLAYDTTVHDDWAITVAPLPAQNILSWDPAEWAGALADSTVAARRSGIVRALGYTGAETAGPRADLIDQLLAEPIVRDRVSVVTDPLQEA